MKRRSSIQSWVGLLIASLGISVMIGWTLRNATLVQMKPEFVAMVFSTGLCFSLLGAGLLLPSRKLVRRLSLRVLFGSMAMGIATLALLENAFNVRLGTDLYMVHSWLVDGNPKPGRMALNTACGFICAGLVLVLVGQVRHRVTGLIIQFATFLVVLLGLTGLVGYSLQLDALYGFRASRMAAHTAVGMTLLGFGLWDSWRHAAWYTTGKYFRDDEKVAFVGAALLIVVALGAGVAGFAAQQSTFETVLGDSLALAVRNHTTIFHVEVEHAVAMAKGTAGRPNLNRLSRQLNTLPSNDVLKRELRVIGESILASGVSGVEIVDTAHRELMRLGKFSSQPALAIDLGLSTPTSLMWEGGFTLKMTLPLRDQDGAIGTIRIEQAMPLIADQLLRGHDQGETGEVRMCFPAREQLHCFPDYRHALPYSTQRDSANGKATPMSLAAFGKLGMFKGLDYRGQQVVAAYGPLAPTGLGLVIKKNTAELLQPIRDQFRWSIPLLLVLVAVGAKLLHSQISPLVSNMLRSERDATERALHIRTVIDSVGEGIFTTDQNGSIESFNGAASAMFGYAADEVIGANIKRLVPDGLLAERDARMAREPNSGMPMSVVKKPIQLPGRRKDGTVFSLELAISHICIGGRNLLVGIARDISVREQDLRALVAARDQLFTAAEVAELGIWTWTPADDTLEWNERMFDLYDVPVEHRGEGLHYDQWRARVHPDDVDGAVAKLNGAVAGTDTYDPIFRVVRPCGQIRFVQAAATVERNAHGKALRVLGINRDITMQHEQEAALRAATTAADDANRAKSEFLANMSHEIRSPMNAVLGMLMLLKKTALDPRQRDYASKAEAAGRALLGILNDILDFSRVEAGKLVLDPQPFSIDQVLRELAVILSANVGEKDIEILYQIDPALPDWVVGDAMRLQQILINLAGNAIKFTASGEVVVSASLLAPAEALQVDAGSAQLVLGFAIRDTGIGISPEQCRHVFDSFSQAEASTARRFGGSGLGLAISRRLVTLMGGRLEVASEVGRGSTFRFNIRCERAVELAPALRRPQAPLQKMTCMVIDDNAMARDTLSAMLASFGWRVDVIESGAQALAALGDEGAPAYDVIFVDWSMAEMDGWETSERIRLMQRTGDTPLIVMVTAHSREELAQRQAKQPAMLDGFVVKPVTSSMLLDAVSDAVANLGALALDRPIATVFAARLCGLRLLVVEDNLTNQQVACELLRHEGAWVAVAGSGHAAIEAVASTVPQFDCILMDIQMPDMDGYAATRFLRAQWDLQRLPIIAMTANAMDSDREAAIAAGMNDHVGKPFDLDRLVAVILRHAGHGAPSAAVIDAHAATGGAAFESVMQGPEFDHVGALARFGGNTAIYGKVLRAFGAEAATLLERVMASPPAQARDSICRQLHTLKGLAGTIGARDLAMQADRLESECRANGTDLSWECECRRLAAAIDNATAHCAALAAELGSTQPAPAADGPIDVAALRAGIVALKAMLDASSLAALTLFDELKHDYGGLMGAEFDPIEEAIGAMHFSSAAQLCDAMLSRQERFFSKGQIE